MTTPTTANTDLNTDPAPATDSDKDVAWPLLVPIALLTALCARQAVLTARM